MELFSVANTWLLINRTTRDEVLPVSGALGRFALSHLKDKAKYLPD
jgi:hypothetical protein